MITKSIRWRLVMWLAFLLVCTLTGFGISAYQLHRTNQLGEIDALLNQRVAALVSDARGRGPPGGPRMPLRPPPDRGRSPLAPGERNDLPPGRPFERPFERPPLPRRGPDSGPAEPREFGPGARELRLSPPTLSLFEETDTNGFYFAVWTRNGALARGSTNTPSGLVRPKDPGADRRLQRRTRGTWREAFQFNERGDCVLAGLSIVEHLKGIERFAGWLIMAGAGVLAIGLGGAWLLATGALRPVAKISASASRIAEGNLSERIDVAETDSELGRLANVLNGTFARLEAAFAEQKQFTADASHELRTPLTVLISEAQTTLARDRTTPEYRESMETCLAAAQQMRQLAESLLQLARLDAGEEPLALQPVDLAEATRMGAQLLEPLAAQRGIRIHCALTPALAVGDERRIAQVITNLLTNAIHYNQDQGEIQVATASADNQAVLTVTDTGQGIAAGDLPHIFKRFYRADKSRTGIDGRSGLGLAITRAIVEAHQGTIEVSSAPGRGTTFTVRLPSPKKLMVDS